MNPLDLTPPTPVSAGANGFNRRSFLRRAGLGTLAAAAAVPTIGGLLAPGQSADAATPSPALDLAILNFALNLEYLEAEYYSYASFGRGIESFGVAVNGTGTPGDVTIKPNAQVPFQTEAIRQYGLEIASDERNHVTFLRNAITAFGGQPVARPAVNLFDSFNTAAQAAGIGAGFDPFANEANFLVGSYIFEDVGVTAYKGGAPLITSRAVLAAAAGILAVEAFHAALIRVFMFELGATTHTLAQQISDLRDSLDGSKDKDQGVVLNGAANIVPTDANGVAYSRTTRQVLNIVYGGFKATSGLFFPNAMNGPIR